MPWSTPTLKDVRSFVRDSIRAHLPGADAAIPNSVLRVLSDAMGALCHLTLQYIDWLAKQLLPDTAEHEWLSRHGDIWLVNADGSTGRKMATLAAGSVTMTGTSGAVIPLGTQLVAPGTNVGYETTEEITIGVTPSPVEVRALDPGALGNMLEGSTLSLANPPTNVDPTATVISLENGVDEESDEQLRTRILLRIQQPPAGGDKTDYEHWALAVPGVTRAWAFPMEMGIGTMTVRFMMDDLRADNDGFPLPSDCETVKAYLDTVRPVTVKDLFVESPIPYPINHRISYLDLDNAATRAAITQSLLNEFLLRTMPGQTWYRAWSDSGIMNAPGVVAYDLVLSDTVMPSSGYMPVLGDITYG